MPGRGKKLQSETNSPTFAKGQPYLLPCGLELYEPLVLSSGIPSSHILLIYFKHFSFHSNPEAKT